MSITSDTLRSLIVNKAPLLNASGSIATNVLVYDANSLQVHAVEANRVFGRLELEVASRLGSVAQCNIGNTDIIGAIIVSASITIPAGTPNVYFPAGWLYSAIGTMAFGFGAYSSGAIPMSGQAILLYNLACCPDTASRDRLLICGGEPFPGGAGVDATVNGSVLLPIVQSNMSPSPMKLPIDLAGLTAGLRVTLQWRQARDFGSGNQIGTITQFTTCMLRCETFDLTNREQSPARLLFNPTPVPVRLGYPFAFISTGTPIVFAAVAGTMVNLTMTGLQNADVSGFVICIRPLASCQQTVANDAPLAPAAFTLPTQYALSLNGAIVVQNQTSQQNELLELISSGASSELMSGHMAAAGAVAPFALTWVRGGVIYVPFGLQRNFAPNGTMINTRRAGSSLPVIGVTMAVTGNYQLDYITTYQALFSNVSGGTSAVDL